MNRALPLLLAAALIVAVILAEVTSGPSAEVAPLSMHPRVAASPVSPAEPNHTDEWVATVLARPLFSPDRRPAPNATFAESRIAGLPRLTGIMVGPFGRTAIFAADGGKPIILQEGGRVGAYTVKSIELAEVRLTGPDGQRILSPSFEHGANQPAQAAAPRRVGQAPIPR